MFAPWYCTGVGAVGAVNDQLQASLGPAAQYCHIAVKTYNGGKALSSHIPSNCIP